MKLGTWRRWVAAMIVAMTMGSPLRASAEETIVEDANAWSKFFDLAGCAVGIATIADGAGAILAVISCGKAASEWWTE